MTFNFTLLEKILGGTVAVLIAIILFKECGNQKHTDNVVNNIVNYKDSAQYYKEKVNGMQVDVAYNKSLILDDKNQLASVIKKDDSLSKVVSTFKTPQSVTVIKEVTTIIHDTFHIEHKIPCDFKTFTVIKDSAFFHFCGTISEKFFTIDTLMIPNKQSIVIGEKKLGFLRGTEQRVEIINSNPLIRTSNIDNYIINQKKKRFGIGASVGYGLNFNATGVRTGVIIGVTANYNLISF